MIFGVSAHLAIESVVAGLRTEALGTDPVRGVPVTLTTYRGALRVRQVSTGSMTMDPDGIHVAAFFVPDSPPWHKPPHAVATEVFLRFYRIRSGETQAQGVREATADLADDPRGGSDRWLRVTFEMPRTTEYAELGYQVIVVTDRPGTAPQPG